MSDTKKTEEVKDEVKDTKKTSETAKKDDAEKKATAKSTAATKTAETKKPETKKTETAKKDDKADKTEDKVEQLSKGDGENTNSEVKDVDISTQESDTEKQQDTAPASDPEKGASDKVDDASETLDHEDKHDEADVETSEESSDDKSHEDKLQLRTVRFRGFTPVYMHPSKKSASANVQGIVYVSGKTVGNFAEILAAVPGLGKTKCYVEKQRVGVK